MNDFQEYLDMFMVLGECCKHYRSAQDLYVTRYPDMQQKSHMAFKRLADRFCRFGTVKQTQVKLRPIVNENNAASILAFAALNPHASSRQMEKKKSVISQRSVLRILHQHKFHPYCMSLHQDLYSNNFLKRVNFCRKIRRKIRTDVTFLSHVLFSDEASFVNTGNVNRHNMHYWANKNPRWMRTVPFQHSWSVNCWCGIVGDHVIGSYFFEGRLTGQVYANFLQNVLPQLMEDCPCMFA